MTVDPIAVLEAQAPDPSTVPDHQLSLVRARFQQATGVDVGAPAEALAPVPPPSSGRSRRGWVAAAAVAAALLGALALVRALDTGDGPDRTDVADETDEGAALLGDLLDVAAAQPEPPTDWGQQYRRLDETRRLGGVTASGEEVFGYAEVERETWTARDGTLVELDRESTVTTDEPEPLDVTGSLPPGARSLPPGSVGGQLSADEIAALPTDPAALRQVLLEQPETVASDDALNATLSAEALLSQPAVTPAVRAALLEVVAGLPGATVTADQLDGSPVVALSVAGGNQVVTLLLDPATSRLVAASGTATAPIEQSGLQPGELVFERTYRTPGFVDRIGARP